MLSKAIAALCLVGAASVCAAAPLTLTVNATGNLYGSSLFDHRETVRFSMTSSYDSDDFRLPADHHGFGPVSLNFASPRASYSLGSNGGADLVVAQYGTELVFSANFAAQQEWGNQEARLVLGVGGAGGLTPADLLIPRVISFDDLTAASFSLQTRDNGGYVIGDKVMFFDNVTVTIAAPVPEPEAYAMLLGGLAVVGALAARRRRAA